MAIKDFVVHIDLSEAGKARQEFALGLAEAHAAHVIAVAYAPLGIVPYYGAPDLFMPPPTDYFDRLREEAGKALQSFSDAATRRGLSVETRVIESSSIDFAEQFAVHARHVDLAVVGQPREEDVAGSPHAMLEEVLFTSGRPLLVMPWTGVGTPQPATVMIGWDGSGTAARAINDSLPFLSRAKQVIVLAVDGRGGDYGEEPGADIALHLARHGVKVTVRRIPGGSDIGVADLLLSQAADLSADMLVIGGYHHSRVREFVLGGVTRTILQSMTVPVLMAH